MKKRLFCFCLAAQALAARAQSPYPAAPGPPPNLIRLEYFVDTDPGFGNGKPIVLTPGQDLAGFTFQADISGLPSGFHRFYVRSLDAAGNWSHAANAFFDNYITPVYATATPAANIVAAEYFIDTDPGFGNGNPIAFTPGTDLANQSVAVNVTGLPLGNHRLYIRTLDASGHWSLTNNASFDNSTAPSYPAAPPAAPNLAVLEYFIDTDPGFGNGMPLSFTPGPDLAALQFDIPVTALSQGGHTLYIRSKQNPWSLTAYASFVKNSALPVTWRFVQGEVKGQGAQISWATGSEQDAAYFEVQYSIDGLQFSPIGKVKASGNAAGSTYAFLHVNPAAGAGYYRLKQVDKDGQFAYSKTIILVFQQNLQSPVLFPNPARDWVNIVLPNQNKTTSISLYDNKGRLLKKLPVAGGQNVLRMETKFLAGGNYYLLVQDAQGSQTLPFLKQ